MMCKSAKPTWFTAIYACILNYIYITRFIVSIDGYSILWNEDFDDTRAQFATIAVPGALSQCGTRKHRREFNGNDMEVVPKVGSGLTRNSSQDKVLRAILSKQGSARVDQHKKYRSEFIVSNGKDLTDALGRDGCSKNCCDYLQFNKDYTLRFETMFRSWEVDLPYPNASRRTDVMDTSVMQLHGVPEGRFILKRDGSIQTNYGTPCEVWRSPPFMLSLSTMEIAGKFVPSWAIRTAYTNESTSWLSTRHTIGRTHWWDGIWPKWNRSAVPDAGQWVSWELELRLSYGNDGVYSMYKNGELVYSQAGPNCYYDRVAPRVHMGLYKWAWPTPSGTEASHDKVMYYDNIRLSDGFTYQQRRSHNAKDDVAVQRHLTGPALWGDGQWQRAGSTAMYPSVGIEETCPYIRDADGECSNHDWRDVFMPAHNTAEWVPADQITWAQTSGCMAGNRWLFFGTGLARSQMVSLACLLRTPTSVFHSNRTHAFFRPSRINNATIWFREPPPLPRNAASTAVDMARLLAQAWGSLLEMKSADVIVIAPDRLTTLVRLCAVPIRHRHGEDVEPLERALSTAVNALCRWLAHLRATRPVRVYITTPLPSWTHDVERFVQQQLRSSEHRPMTWEDLVQRSNDVSLFQFDETGSIRHWDQYIYYETIRAAAELRIPVLNIYDAAKYQMMDRTHFFAPPIPTMPTQEPATSDPVRMCLPGSVDTFNAMLVSAECLHVRNHAQSTQGVRHRRAVVRYPPPPPPATTNMSAGVCGAYDWLFVFGTGRSGSSTVLQMLNSVPAIRLSGENYGLYAMLHDSKTLVNNTNAWGTQRNPAWGDDPDFHGIQDDICSWLLHMTPTPVGEHATIRGFKEIRPQCLPPVVQDFPRAKFIINYRRNLTSHALSYQRMHPELSLERSEELLQEKLDKFRLALADVPPSQKMELPLEDFSASAFNKVLAFLGMTQHRFQCVLHSNAHKADERDGECEQPLLY
eukprot:m.998816 g.998816  ORF g.998816 m.998816 type:complete len:975 (-) comp24025_c0_seq26:735-3659(-)